MLLAPGARLRRLVCCFVSFANQCSGVSLCHDYGMIRRSLYLDRSPGLSFVQKRSSFTPRHERPRDDPSSGGGRRPFPTNPTSTTSHPARRLASSSKLLKSSIPLPSSLRINGRRLTFKIYCNPHDEASSPASLWPPKSWIGSRRIYADDQVRRISDSAATNLPVLRSPNEKFFPIRKTRCGCRVSRSPWYGTGILWHYHPWFLYPIRLGMQKDKCTLVASIRAFPPPTD